MNFFKNLSHEAKVILSIVGSGVVTLCSNPEMLTMLLTMPVSVSLPVILPKLIATGALGGALYNMKPKQVSGSGS